MNGVTHRDYEGDADFDGVRDFLIATYSRFGWMYNWGQERWDIQRFGINNEEELAGERFWEDYVQLWEAHLRKRVMAEPLPERPVADGYVVRSLDLIPSTAGAVWPVH